MPEFTNHQSWKCLAKLVSSPGACPGTASTALPKSFKWQSGPPGGENFTINTMFSYTHPEFFFFNSIVLNVHGGSQDLNSPFSWKKMCTKKLEKTSLTVHKHTSTTSENCTNSPYTHSMLWCLGLVTFNSCQRKNTSPNISACKSHHL